jgi:hypothetical protein
MALTFAEAKQLELLKKMRPVDRFLLMTQLINAQFEAMKAGLRYMNPNLSESELNQCLRERMKKIYSLRS